MQKVLNNNKGYETIMEVSDVLKPEGHKHVKIYSRWSKAKDPNEKQLKFSVTLSEDELFSLQQFLANI